MELAAGITLQFMCAYENFVSIYVT